MVLEDWEETDIQSQNRKNPEQGSGAWMSHLFPPQAFGELLSFVTSLRTERPATDSYSLGSCFLNMATLEKLGIYH